MTRLRHILLAAALVLAGGCGGDDKKNTGAGDGGAGDGGGKESGAPNGTEAGTGTPDGGGETGTTSLTLVDWVTDLITNHSGAGDLPDTVDDKNIIDTTDPAAFDPLLNK